MKIFGLKILLNSADFLKRDEKSLYRVYKVPKKSGGERLLCEPCPELKALQRELVPFFKQFRVTKYAAAYEKGCSVKNNALSHAGARHILHTDVRDFFPSVSFGLFKKTFCKGMDEKTVDRLWRAVSFARGLPIGAPTSPFIGNRVLYKADKKLGKLKMRYTRYADDLIFSAQKPIDAKVTGKIAKILAANGFSLNRKKTYFMAGRKQVTGILLHGDELSVGTPYKKRLKQELYNFLTKREGHPDILRGKLAHLKYIEPEYAQNLKNKYRPLDKDGFLRFL
ncbi:MAG: reverse transcriptase family protein [Firmicutes bacterium]|nr:reverse transcriptase family protein [Bacillota bacterium]